jgi:hypothetical protein
MHDQKYIYRMMFQKLHEKIHDCMTKTKTRKHFSLPLEHFRKCFIGTWPSIATAIMKKYWFLQIKLHYVEFNGTDYFSANKPDIQVIRSNFVNNSYERTIF